SKGGPLLIFRCVNHTHRDHLAAAVCPIRARRNMAAIDVVIADNQPMSLSGLRSAVADQSDIRILAECQNPERLLDAVRNYSPDVLLVSAEILREELKELELLVSEIEETRVIVVTNRKDMAFLEGALRCGAKGV